MYDYIVVGKGLIGSAALRYLSRVSANVAAIGPDEPISYKDHNGVFAGHYDQTRITRIIDPDLVWATLAKRSIARYRKIEKESGMHFFSEVGCLHVAQRPTKQDDYIAANERVAIKLGISYQLLDDTDLRNTFSFLDFPTGHLGIMEHSTAGYINPRVLIAAQLVLAKMKGAKVIKETVVRIHQSRSHVDVETDCGARYRAKKVLIAAGAFTNCYHLLEQKLDFAPTAETVLLARLSDEQAKYLETMPSLIYRMRSHPDVMEVYLLPPVQYPDGHYYLKIGGDFKTNCVMRSLEELKSWFHTEGSPSTGEKLKEVLMSIMPDLKLLSYVTKPCVIAETRSGWPYVDTVVESKVFVATGGCGVAAESADEIGRLGALLAERETWTDELDSACFKSVLLDTEYHTTQPQIPSATLIACPEPGRVV